MTGCLIGTNVVLIALAVPEKLPRVVKAALRAGTNVVSVVTYWEVVLKTMKGKLDVGDPRLWWKAALDDLSATQLPLYSEHISALQSLPPVHYDPFDRILIAQAAIEDLALVTMDRDIRRYAGERLRVIG